MFWLPKFTYTVAKFIKKEHYDTKVIDTALKQNIKNEAKERKTHFVYVGRYYCCRYLEHDNKLRSLFIEGMKKYKIKSVMLTNIYMQRLRLITKEAMEIYSKGRIDRIESVNDDLETFFDDLKHGKQPKEESWTYFIDS